jgi:hypothetical protein
MGAGAGIDIKCTMQAVIKVAFAEDKIEVVSTEMQYGSDMQLEGYYRYGLIEQKDLRDCLTVDFSQFGKPELLQMLFHEQSCYPSTTFWHEYRTLQDAITEFGIQTGTFIISYKDSKVVGGGWSSRRYEVGDSLFIGTEANMIDSLDFEWDRNESTSDYTSWLSHTFPSIIDSDKEARDYEKLCTDLNTAAATKFIVTEQFVDRWNAMLDDDDDEYEQEQQEDEEQEVIY